MMTVSDYRGTRYFGRAYQRMYEQHVHAPGSDYRILLVQMVHLRPETTEYLYSTFSPKTVTYSASDRPVLEDHVRCIITGCSTIDATVEAVVAFCTGLGDRAPSRLDEMEFGGTEEEIIQRGSTWCTHVARVGCVLFQAAGLPSHLLFAADTETAYSGHALAEFWRSDRWAAVDPTYGTVFRRRNGDPVSIWDLVQNSAVLDDDNGCSHLPYRPEQQFRAVAIANYNVSDWRLYDYSVSRINPYYRRILEMAEQGWDGGPRWLADEDL